MNTSDAERETFARIRGACQRSSPENIAAELAALARPRSAPLPADNLCDALQENLRRNGASTVAVHTRIEAVMEISRFTTDKQRQRRVVTGHDPRLAALPWRDGGLLPRFDVAQADDALAVSYAYCAVAETGSLMLMLDRNNPALNNLIVEDHVILVDRHCVYDRLEEMWTLPKRSTPEDRARGIMMISGPSSTADIEMELVRGAHGPRALHVIIVGERSKEECR